MRSKSTGRGSRLLMLVVGTAVGMVAGAAPALGASTADVQNGDEDIEVNGDNGVNVWHFSEDATTVTITDTSGITPQNLCAAVNATTVTCPRSTATTLVDEVDVDAEDGDDVITSALGTFLDVDGNDGADNFSGGPGRDRFESDAGDDILTGNGGNDDLDGESGNDTITGGVGDDEVAGGPGTDTVSGGEGEDSLGQDPEGATVFSETDAGDTYDGGPGFDRVEYGASGTGIAPPLAITLTLDGVANDGAANENDNVLNVERVQTGDGNDSVTGTDGAEVFFGGLGDDTLRTLGGRDRINGEGGDDLIDAGESRDLVFCGSGTDVALRSETADDLYIDCERTGAEVDPANASIKGKRAKVGVHCPLAEGANCVGRLTLRDGSKLIAAGNYNVAAGQTNLVGAKLKKAGRKLAKSLAGGVAVLDATATTTEPNGVSIHEDVVVAEVVKPKKKKKKKRG